MESDSKLFPRKTGKSSVFHMGERDAGHPRVSSPHRQTGVLHEISDTAKAVFLYTFGRSLTCFQPGGWFR